MTIQDNLENNGTETASVTTEGEDLGIFHSGKIEHNNPTSCEHLAGIASLCNHFGFPTTLAYERGHVRGRE